MPHWLDLMLQSLGPLLAAGLRFTVPLTLIAFALGQAAVALGLLIVGFTEITILDPVAARRGEAPLFFERLRPAQIPLAVLSLGALLAYRLTT